MKFPSDATMLMLLSIWRGQPLDAVAGELRLTLPAGDSLPAPQESLDHLESVGWVEITEAGEVAATDRGKYALDRWFTKRANAAGRHGCFSITDTRIRAVAS